MPDGQVNFAEGVACPREPDRLWVLVACELRSSWAQLMEKAEGGCHS